MKRIFKFWFIFIVILIPFMASCFSPSPEVVALVNQGPPKAIFRASFDEVWSAVVQQVLREGGFAIKTSDKEGGVIVADRISLGLHDRFSIFVSEKPEGVEATCAYEVLAMSNLSWLLHPSLAGIKYRREVERKFLKLVEEKLSKSPIPVCFFRLKSDLILKGF
jgi:hypothetical protein